MVALAYAWNLVVRQKKSVWEAIIWTVFWGGIAAFAFKPEWLDTLGRLTGIKRRENVATVTSIGLLFFLVFYLIIRMEELSQRLTNITRDVALREAGLPEKKPFDSAQGGKPK